MKKLFLLLILVLFASLACAETMDVYMFYSTGCPHCAKMHEFLDDVERDYDVNIMEYELHDKEALQLYFRFAEEYGVDTTKISVPVVFVHHKYFVGMNQQIEDGIIAEIEECGEAINETCGPAFMQKLTLPAVITAAAVDSINPCAFAVLIILLTTILVAGTRRKSLMAGIAFTAAIFISYFLMGLGLYSALQAAGVTRIFYIIVAITAIFVGLFNLKDYLWYGKWFKMEIPESWRPSVKRLIKGVTSVPGAFIVGFLVSLFLLPCTSGPYIIILGLLAQVTTRFQGILLLLLYNFVFILPMIIINLVIYFGFTTTEKAEAWRQRKLRWLHLIAGIIILLLGIGMLIALGKGFV